MLDNGKIVIKNDKGEELVCDVLFTFDDGGISFLTIIAPILEKYNQKGIFFISTQYIDTPLFLTKKQIKELRERGHIIGSHSHSHPQNISELANSDLLEEYKNEIFKEKARKINTLGHDIIGRK